MKIHFVGLSIKTIAIGVLIMFFWSCSSIDKTIRQGDFDLLISKYSGNIAKNDPELNYQIAEAYRLSNRIQEAEPFYQSAVTKGVVEEDAFFYFARSQKSNQKYDLASQTLEKYLPQVKDQKIRVLMENELNNLNTLNNLKGKDTYYRAKNMEDLNTPSAEFGPVYVNGFLYFTSNRSGGKIYKTTGTPFLDIYRVRTQGANVNIRTLEALDPIINHSDINEGSLAISSDGLSIIYAKGNNGKATGNTEVNLFFTRFRNGTWLDPRPLTINDPESWDSTPALSPDGNTLYFSSTRPGGYGGADLYSAKLNRRGRWVDVRNLGPEINTPNNEMFPFESIEGSLYFSSDGHPGFGKLDVFKSYRSKGLIAIENLGEPMNSAADDFGFYEFDLTRGFFSSNRKGGKGDDDIYTFINDDPNLKIVNYYLAGTTVTNDGSGAEIVVSNSKISLVDEEGKVIDEVFTGEDGAFKVRVYTEENYNLIAEKADYFTTRKEFSTIGKSIKKDTLTEFITNVTFSTKIHLDRIVLEKPVVLNNIYYDLDKADIRKDAAKVLDSLVLIMNDNPDIFIELGSHTDARAAEDYNLDLSWRRARSAVNYIISKGIVANRITAKGYGESQLLIKNAQTEQEHQVNRRTEFKVLRYNPNREIEEQPTEEELDEYDRFFNSGNG